MERRMKITVGLGAVDDFLPFVRAGADECFAGYVPDIWNTNGGELAALNRREVSYYQVQIGSRSEMEILGYLSQKTGVPVTITLNSLFYLPEQYGMILEIIRDCLSMGFSSYIIADPALLLLLKQEGLSEKIHIHISGELGEMNREVMEYCLDMNASRIIFHRKVSLKEMEKMIRSETYRKRPARSAGPEMAVEMRNPAAIPEKRIMEYEAFALNEMCHFHGGFCYSLHCDALPHMCRVPYRLGVVEGESEKQTEAEKSPRYGKAENTISDRRAPDSTREGNPIPGYRTPDSTGMEGSTGQEPSEESADGYLPGVSGCALCALWRMRGIGITHLKLVSRGNYGDETVKDIRILRRALDILDEAGSEESYLRKMKTELFPSGCSRNCYYLP